MYSTIDDFILAKTIGKGRSATVKKAYHPDGSKIALKIFKDKEALELA